MTRRGRKRKSGLREKNGRIVRRNNDLSPEQIVGMRMEIGSTMPHRTAEIIWLNNRRQIPKEKRGDDLAEHPLGRLHLVGAISRLQYDAGVAFARAVVAVRRVLDCRKPPQSIAGHGQPSPPTPKEMDEGKCIQTIADYMDAFCAIGPRPSQLAVKHVVVQECDLAPGLFQHLDIGLLNLVNHYGLTSR